MIMKVKIATRQIKRILSAVCPPCDSTASGSSAASEPP
jgi:hypothetical protein